MYRLPAAVILVPLLLGSGLALGGCSRPDGVEPYYFLLAGPLLQGGGLPPTTPGALVGGYNPYLRQVELRWSVSLDPDFNIPVGTYRIYLYQNGPPREYYQLRDLFDETPVTSYNIDADPFTGAVYFVVTGFDGRAESAPTNYLRVDVFTR